MAAEPRWYCQHCDQTYTQIEVEDNLVCKHLIHRLRPKERKMALYEYVIIERPTKRDEEKGELERILHGPKLVAAANEDDAKVQALVGFTVPDGVVKSRVGVVVRSFADAS